MTKESEIASISLVDYVAWGCPNPEVSCPGDSGESLLNVGEDGILTCSECGLQFVVVKDNGVIITSSISS